ncbi:hypothetical protein QBC32DRAFT_229844, partial [Pseudoneurospora amorphoporcata]
MDGMADYGPLAGRRVLSSFNFHSGRHMFQLAVRRVRRVSGVDVLSIPALISFFISPKVEERARCWQTQMLQN